MASDVTTKILDIQVSAKDAIDQIAKYRKEVADAMAQQKELKKELEGGIISEKEYGRNIESTRIFINQQNQAINLLTRQITNQVKEQKAQNGSLVQLRASLSNLTAEYDRLGKAEREGAQGQELKERINEVTKELKSCEEETQRFFRNVGNYPDAAQPLVEQLAKLKEKMAEMEAAGKGSGPEFDNLKSKVQDLESALEDVNEKGAPGLTEVIGKINEVATALVVWKNVSKELGIENQTVDKIITGLGTALTIYKTVTTVATSSTKALTVAQRAFNVAMKANPIGLFVTAVAGAVAAVTALASIFNIFGGDSAKRKKQFEEEASALEGLGKAYSQEVERLKAMGKNEAEVLASSVDNLKRLRDAWTSHYYEAIELYDLDSEEYKNALEKKNKSDEEYRDKQEEIANILTKMFAEEGEKQIAEEMERMGMSYSYKVTKIRQEMDEWKKLYEMVNKMRGTFNEQGKANFDKRMDEIAERRISELNKEEEKKTEEARKKAVDAAKRRREEQERANAELQKEMQAGEDALLEILKESLDKQLEVEQRAFKREKKTLEDKLALYKTNSQYDIQMRKAINDQITALIANHEHKITEIKWAEKERQIQIQNEIIQAKLDNVKKGTESEKALLLEKEEAAYKVEKDALQKRIDDGLLSDEQANQLRIEMLISFENKKKEIEEKYAQQSLEQQKIILQNEIEQLDIAETEKKLHRAGWRTMTDEEMEADRQRKLESIGGYEAAKLRLEEENAQRAYEALLERGQLSTQTDAEWLAEQNAAKEEWLNKQVAINDAYVKNEQAKQQAVRAVTNGLISLLENLGDENSAFAKMAKVITLAQIAIDTGRALSSGIASASALPFPANLAAIATTVATVLANVATAISTVKSAKFATGGKVTGPGTGTSDSIPAMLSNGEYVMTARATKMFEPLLAALNGIGAGVPIQVAGSYESVDNAEMMTDSFEKAAREIKPVVSVVEITEAQERVDMIENLDNF